MNDMIYFGKTAIDLKLCLHNAGTLAHVLIQKPFNSKTFSDLLISSKCENTVIFSAALFLKLTFSCSFALRFFTL